MKIAIVLLAASAAVPYLCAQPEPAKPAAFEVASIKPHPLPPGRLVIRVPTGAPFQLRNDTFDRDFVTLADLIMEAYGILDHQLYGAPDWAASPSGDRYAVIAKAAGSPTPAQAQEMLQALLADRFRLKLHREMRELPVYALVVARNGHKLRKLGDDEKVPTFATRPVQPAKTLMSPIAALAARLAAFVDRPVIDRTGLAGIYEYANLDWTRFRRGASDSLDSDPADSVYAALQRDLGLKLESRKDPVEVLIIDHAEKPTEN